MRLLQIRTRVNSERAGMISSINIIATRSRRKSELSANFDTQLTFDGRKSKFVVALGSLQLVELGDVLNVGHFCVLERRYEVLCPFFRGYVVRWLKKSDFKVSVLPNELPIDIFKNSVDYLKLPFRASAEAVIQHRVLLRKVEKLQP